MSYGIYLFLFFCGVAASISASNKGKNGGFWFIIGIALGPVGVIISLLLNAESSEVDKKSIKLGTSKKCKYCAELIKPEAVVCKHCGREQIFDVNDVVVELTGGNASGVTIHKLLQDAIYKNDFDTVNKIVDSGVVLSENDLPFSHIEYANLHGSTEIIKTIEKALLK